MAKSHNQGIKNHFYKHGLYIKEKKWKQEVYSRDNFTCQFCFGTKGCAILNAHHIKSRKKYPELIFNVDNGITLCDSCHISLHNRADGNPMAGKKHSEESKEKISLALMGRKFSEETRRKMSENNVGFKGRKHSEETKQKMSESHKGNTPMLGKKHTEETKQKMSESQKKRQAKKREIE